MGTWGTGIFDSDLAADVRDEWREALMDGLETEEAKARVIGTFAESTSDPDEAVVFWTALAAAQLQTGRLQDAVRDRALQLIAAGGDVARWEEEAPADASRRRRALERLAAKLQGPQPLPKRLRRQPVYNVEFDTGDVVLLRNGRGSQALFIVVEQEPYRGVYLPVVEALLWDAGPIPPPDELEQLPSLHSEGALPPSYGSVLERPPHPVTPLRAEIWVIHTSRKSELFGPHVGEVVAKGVPRSISRDISRGGYGLDTWSGLADWVDTPYFRRMIELTRQAWLEKKD